MKRSARPRPFAFVLLLVFALATTAVGCPCLRSAVNADPALRWWLFSNFGASKLCPEMLKRGVPLKIGLMGPQSVGRFFPQQCAVHVDDAQRVMRVDLTGDGYAVVPVARRVGFYAGLSVEYAPDFHLEEDSIYVWGRYRRALSPPDLRLKGVENPIINLATSTPAGDLATVLGRLVIESELARGFTVVRQTDGDDFAVGILSPPQKPIRQFASGSDRITLASDLTEIRAASRDYLGPFAVEKSDAELRLKARVAGAPVDYVVVDKNVGDAWRRGYELAQPLGPPPGGMIAHGQLLMGVWERAVAVAPGSYYIVLENRALAGTATWGMPVPFESVAGVSYTVEVARQ